MRWCVNHCMEQPSDDTPSVTPFGRDSSLREGAGRGAYHSTGYSLTSQVTGDFHRPYETQRVLHSTIQPGACETGRVRAIFIAPTKLKEFDILPLIEVHSLSLAFARQLPQRGSRDGLHHSSGCSRNRRGTGDFHRPYETQMTFPCKKTDALNEEASVFYPLKTGRPGRFSAGAASGRRSMR